MRSLLIISIFIAAAVVLLWASFPSILEPLSRIVLLAFAVGFLAAAIVEGLHYAQRKGWIE